MEWHCWKNFVSGFKIVRDLNEKGYWLLVTDVFSGQAKAKELSTKIDDYRKRVYLTYSAQHDSKIKDGIGSLLQYAYHCNYNIEVFSHTYGVIENEEQLFFSKATGKNNCSAGNPIRTEDFKDL